MPLRVAVPSPLSVKVTPSGRSPVSVIVSTGGQPFVVTVNGATSLYLAVRRKAPGAAAYVYVTRIEEC